MNLAKQLRGVAQNFTILYAEDEEWLREEMRVTLERFFKKVLVAEDGKEAFDIYKSNEVDLIITDINMPNIDGIELIKQIKNSTTDAPPIIVLTAYDDTNNLLELIKLNIDGFLMKPTEKENLAEVLFKICSHIEDKILLQKSEQELRDSYEVLHKQNRVLKTKLNQIAKEKNLLAEKEEAENPENRQEQNSSSNIKDLDHDYFKYLEHEDIEEINELSDEIDSYVNLLFRSDKIEDIYITKLSIACEMYAATLNKYGLFYEVGIELLVFSQDLVEHTDVIKSSQENAALLLESLYYLLNNFKINVLETEAKNPRFFNKSIISDMKTISNFLKGVEEHGEAEFF